MRLFGFAVIALSVGCSRPDPSREDMARMLREDIGYTRRLLTFEIGSPDASLSEFQGFCDKAIEERTERLIKIQALASTSPIGAKLMEAVNPELEAENSLVRGKRRIFEEYARAKTLRDNYDQVGKQWALASRASDGLQKKANGYTEEQRYQEAREALESALSLAESARDSAGRLAQLSKEIQEAAGAATDASAKWAESVSDFSKLEAKAAGVYSSNSMRVDRLDGSLLTTAVNTSNNIVAAVKSMVPK